MCASEGEIVRSLQGNRREEHLFALKQALKLYDSYQSSIGECDEQLARVLGKLGRPVKVPTFDLGTALYRTCGVDLTRIDGIGSLLSPLVGSVRPKPSAPRPKLARLIYALMPIDAVTAGKNDFRIRELIFCL